MSSSEKPPEHPFVGDSGVRAVLTFAEDPFRLLDELMVVIEALCPTWPSRDGLVNSDAMLL
ncbi:MAG TPA: hypothetical protein VMD49_10885 [Steroidobacteraceae bacterium]|nr:hypothetical protein [Steroidobacteraceae bacterium]